MPSRLVPLFLPLLVPFAFVLALLPGRLPPCEGKDGYQHHQQPAAARKSTPFFQHVTVLKKNPDWLFMGHVLNNKWDQLLSPGKWCTGSNLPFWLSYGKVHGTKWLTDPPVSQSVLKALPRNKKVLFQKRRGKDTRQKRGFSVPIT